MMRLSHLRKNAAVLSLALLMPACALPALAQQAAALNRLDDTGTRVMGLPPRMQWNDAGNASTMRGQSALLGQTQVEAVVNTAAWMGRPVRIYLVMPKDAGSPTLRVRWQGSPPWLDGAIAPGERTLVFAGVVTQARMQGMMNLYLTSGADWSRDTLRLDFHFELEPQ